MAVSAKDAEWQAVVLSGLLRRIDDVDVDYNWHCCGWDAENDVPIPAKKRLSLALKKLLLIIIQHQSDKHWPLMLHAV